MKRSIYALAVSLLIILCALIAHWSEEKPKNLGMETPKGIPPSQKPPLPERPAQPVKTPEEAVERAIVAESAPAAPDEWVIVDVRVQVTHNGQPLPGACMIPRRIEIRPDNGLRSRMDLFDLSALDGAERSDQDGNVMKRVRYPAGIAGDSLFGVAVYHDVLGTAYDEVTVDELQAGEVLELEPELGQVLTGKIVDVNGEPIPNARVYISASTPPNTVCLSGLGARSGPDGSFMIPGLRFGSTLRSVSASTHAEQYLPEEKILLTENGTTERVVDPDRDFNEEENSWTLGDIALAIEKSAVDVTTGEATPLPSDE